MSKQIRIDFYKVNSERDFRQALNHIWNLRNEDARTFQFSDGPVRLRQLRIIDGLVTGDMVRIRLGEPAFMAKVHGGERPITQDEDEGLGETNAFLYHPNSGYIAYQRNRHGVSATRTAYYVEQKNNLNRAITFDPVIADVAVNQLTGKCPPRRLRIKVVAGNLTHQSVRNAALEEIIDATNQMHAAEVEITFGMGRKRRSGMDKASVINVVRTALRLKEAGHDVKALEVSAADEGGDRAEVLDFLHATVKSFQQVEPSPLINEFYHRRLACVRAAWDQHQGELP